MLKIGSIFSLHLAKSTKRLVNSTRSIHDVAFSASIDWVERGALLPVRRQIGNTCFVVAVVDVTASARHIYYGEELVALAAQEILDCTPWNPKKGGSEIMAYDYIYRQGITLEKYYPYTGVKGKYKKSRKFHSPRVSIDGYYEMAAGNEYEMSRILQYHPITVSIACHTSFDLYKRGLYKPPRFLFELDMVKLSDKSDLENHQLLEFHEICLVGMGTYNGEPAWLIKNSWGKQWGVGGYAYISRDGSDAGAFGINCWPTYPIIGDHERYEKPRLYKPPAGVIFPKKD